MKNIKRPKEREKERIQCEGERVKKEINQQTTEMNGTDDKELS